MKKYVPFLKRTTLFSGAGDEDIIAMLDCLHAAARRYGRGEYAFRRGEYIRELMLLAEGRLQIQKEDYWGNLNILSEIRPGEMFGEAYIAPNSGPPFRYGTGTDRLPLGVPLSHPACKEYVLFHLG